MSYRFALLSLFAHAVSGTALAQCVLQPVPSGRGVPSLSGPVTCSTVWDPDGAGPLPARLVVGGEFDLAGDAPSAGIAAFDPVANQWTSLGMPGGQPVAFTVLPNGTLLACGWFQTSPSVTVSVIQWNGTAWMQFGPFPPVLQGVSPAAIAAAPNGDVWLAMRHAVVYRLAGGVWQTVGTAAGGFQPPELRALAIAPNGDLLAAGVFASMNAVAANGVARWNGTVWSPLGAGVDGRVHALAFDGSGGLFAGGFFPTAGGAPAANVARWSGSAWSPLGSGTASSWSPPAGVVRALLVQPNGDVIAGGEFSAAGGIAANQVARWNGATWSAMGSGLDPVALSLGELSVCTLAHLGGDVFAGGNFLGADGRDSTGLARWNGVAWSPLRASGLGGGVHAMHLEANGDLYVGGTFREIDGQPFAGIARRVGAAFLPLGTGLALPASVAYASHIARDANGDLVVAGAFTSAGGMPAAFIARWDGAVWQSLGAGLVSPNGFPQVSVMQRAANGDLLVAGMFNGAGGLAAESVARWNGTTWSPMPGLLASPASVAMIQAAAAMPNGEVFVAGTFDLGGPGNTRIARWNGASWQVVGFPDSHVMAMLALANGDLLVAGQFTQIGSQPLSGVARWSNGVWSSVGGAAPLGQLPQVWRLFELPNGHVLASGFLELGAQPFGLARWDGATWQGIPGSPMGILSMAFDPSGQVIVGGGFSTLAATASARLGAFATPCPATAVIGGAGCVGSGGANVLFASSLPWLGSTFGSTASGMPANGLAVAVHGLGTATVPLAAILPQGAPGCSLLVTPDLLSAHVLTGGSLAIALPLPLTPSLVGAVLHQQVVPLDLAASGAIVALTSTNRLTLTLGQY